MWAIPKELRTDGTFIGAEALRDIVAEGPQEKRVGLKPEGRQPVRAGAALDGRRGSPSAASPPAASARRPATRSPWATSTRRSLKPRHPLFADVRGTKVPVDVALAALHPAPLPQRMSPMATTYFTEDHEWIRVEGGIATVGITDYAQEQLGDLVFVELPEAGETREEGRRRGGGRDPSRPRPTSTPRSTARSPRPTPRCPPIRPSVNSAATGDGWLWKMKLADKGQLSGLMDEAALQAHIA